MPGSSGRGRSCRGSRPRILGSIRACGRRVPGAWRTYRLRCRKKRSVPAPPPAGRRYPRRVRCRCCYWRKSRAKGQLSVDRGAHLQVAMADKHGSRAKQEVDIFIAVDILANAFTTFQNHFGRKIAKAAARQHRRGAGVPLVEGWYADAWTWDNLSDGGETSIFGQFRRGGKGKSRRILRHPGKKPSANTLGPLKRAPPRRGAPSHGPVRWR